MSRLSHSYENAYTDFYGSGTPCVYKSGDAWHKRTGNQSQGIYRAARPIYNHPIRPVWLATGWTIVEKLDALDVDWNAINPLAYADAGEAVPFCPFIITIGVEPFSLAYNDAVAAAAEILSILSNVGFPHIPVAFIESQVHCSAGPKLLSFNPLIDPVPELRKDFSHALGVSIAPLKSPHYEGTGALYYRLSSDDERVALLTCAHVARPPPLFQNKAMTLEKVSAGQAREDIIALGTGAWDNALKAIMKEIGDQWTYIEGWTKSLNKLGEPVDDEDPDITERRNEIRSLVEKAKKRIERGNKLHDEVTKYRSTADSRVIGSVIHCSEIKIGVEPHKFTNDWGFIEIDREMIDWPKFEGNKIYVGGNQTEADYVNLMYPQVSDRKNFIKPEEGLLQAFGVVPKSEFHNPQNLDIHNQKTLLCAKHGRSTRTTFGRVNGLESFTRHYKEYGIRKVSVEIAVLGYDTSNLKYTKFSDPGDSGAIVVGRDGRIIGILTGGGGPTNETDITYITPYWWLDQEIKKVYPGCFLYPVVE